MNNGVSKKPETLGGKSRALCGICPQDCYIEEGHAGFCRARRNVGGTVTADNYGLITSMALDPHREKAAVPFPLRKQDTLRGQLRVQPALPVLPEP